MRWLHISDIHIDASKPDVDVTRFQALFLKEMKAALSVKAVDCIIFTGDLFNRGKWEKGQECNAKNFLCAIYKLCSEKGGWNWEPGEPMTRLFYCPGNHDVLREAYQAEGGIVVHRKDALKCVSGDGRFVHDDHKKLLTEVTFGMFESTMQTLTRDAKAGAWSSDLSYEYKIFTVPGNEGKWFPVIGINTALLAGQTHSPDQVSVELSEAHSAFVCADASLDTKKALDAYEKYHVAVQKKLGHLANDEGNLCFISEEAQGKIANALKACKIPIVFGHHPLSFLSKEAVDWYNCFALQNDAYIYLCGHTHQVKGVSEHTISGATWNPQRCYQITVSGAFFDGSGYNQPAFSIGEITLETLRNGKETGKLHIDMFMLTKDAFGYDCLFKSEAPPADIPVHYLECIQDDESAQTEDNLKENEAAPADRSDKDSSQNTMNLVDSSKKEKENTGNRNYLRDLIDDTI